MHFKLDANSEGLREVIELLVPKGSEASYELGRKGHCDQLVLSVMGQVSTKRPVYHHSLLILPFEKMIPGFFSGTRPSVCHLFIDLLVLCLISPGD